MRKPVSTSTDTIDSIRPSHYCNAASANGRDSSSKGATSRPQHSDQDASPPWDTREVKFNTLLLFMSATAAVLLGIIGWTVWTREKVSTVELDRVCKEVPSDYCLQVVDKVDKNRDSAVRLLLRGTSLVLSEVPLLRPKGAIVEHRHWRIDNRHRLLKTHSAAMALAPLVAEALQTEEQSGSGQRVLFIGMPMDGMDMWMHTQFPWLDITVHEQDPVLVKLGTKWFGIADDAKRRTIVGDWLAAIKSAAENSEQFDLLVVDAQQSHSLLSDSEALANAKQILRPAGLFQLSIAQDNTEWDVLPIESAQRKLLATFAHCARLQTATEDGKIAMFACFPAEYKFDASKMDELAQRFELSKQMVNVSWV